MKTRDMGMLSCDSLVARNRERINHEQTLHGLGLLTISPSQEQMSTAAAASEKREIELGLVEPAVIRPTSWGQVQDLLWQSVTLGAIRDLATA